VIVVALIIMAAAADDATSDDASAAARIAKGNAALEALEFDEAADILMQVVVDPNATDDERFEANLLAGTAHRILGHDDEARLCFRYVILKRPAFRMNPAKSPKVVQFFDLVRQEVEAENAAHAGMNQERPTSTNPPVVAADAESGSVLPAVLVGGGALTLVAGAALVAFAEVSLGEPHTAEAQESLVWTGRGGLIVASAGAIAAAGGVALWGAE
jgi:hypothetical protein